ncbi:PA2779 family protein [Aquisalimonas sp.]|uniref:PA2779 family protein n=1 Tax=unclassified Aquisalimonas TaxID=2644645 RepID=UPI0025BA8C84|nr:PA2779 family protein [Aquisalimonas sp.]
MESLRHYRRLCALPLILMLALSGLFAQTASAGIVGTETMISADAPSEQERLQSMIERDDVQEQLIARGVDPADAMERAANLSDAEAAEMNAQIDNLPAGSGTVTILLVIILLLLILR